MYVSSLKRYKLWYKIYLIIYIFTYCVSILIFNNTKELIIFFDFSTILYCWMISQIIFIKQDRYIEENYNEIYKRYNYVCFRPIAISLRLLTYDKEFLFLPKEIRKLILETKNLLYFFLKLFF